MAKGMEVGRERAKDKVEGIRQALERVLGNALTMHGGARHSFPILPSPGNGEVRQIGMKLNRPQVPHLPSNGAQRDARHNRQG